MLRFDLSIVTLLVTTFGGASDTTLAAATSYQHNLPLKHPKCSLPHQRNLPDYFEIDEPCDGLWANSIYSDPGSNHRFFLQNLDSMANNQSKMDYDLQQLMKTFKVGTASFFDPSPNWNDNTVKCKCIQQSLR